MGRYDRYNEYPRYVRVSEQAENNAEALKRLEAEQDDVRPVVPNGRTLAQSWWGKSWNRNLQRYADYSNRIGRGRSYLRNGAVLDLRLSEGRIEARVAGSNRMTYTIRISLDPLDPVLWEKLQTQASGKFDSLAALLKGDFPKELKELLFEDGQGLFPTPSEIHLDCNCPDWADMCKHVAAALYGVGCRMDDEPTLLFSLRHIDPNQLIAETAHSEASQLIDKAEHASSKRILSDDSLSAMFGIDLEEDSEPIKLPKKRKTKKKRVKTQTSPMQTLLKVCDPNSIYSAYKLHTLLPQWELSTIRTTLKKAFDAGHLVRVGNGRYRLP